MGNEIVRHASPLNTVSAMLTVRESLSARQPLDLNGVKERTLELVIANTHSGSTGDRCAAVSIRTALLSGNGILVSTRDAELLHAEVKRGPLDSQSGSSPIGAGDNPPRLF